MIFSLLQGGVNEEGSEMGSPIIFSPLQRAVSEEGSEMGSSIIFFPLGNPQEVESPLALSPLNPQETESPLTLSPLPSPPMAGQKLPEPISWYPQRSQSASVISLLPPLPSPSPRRSPHVHFTIPSSSQASTYQAQSPAVESEFLDYSFLPETLSSGD